LLLAACGAPPDGGAPTSGDQTFTTTAVTIKSDGTFATHESTITLAQELEERDRLATQGASGGSLRAETTFGTCAATDLWVFDGPNETGNRLCLMNAISVPPTMFPLWWIGWGGRVKSYRPGRDYGYFQGAGCTDLFVRWQGNTNETTCPGATGVELGVWPIQ
jgi:hypothetical protein